MNPNEVVLSFVEAINAKEPDTLLALMADEHVFIDSDGAEMAGRGRMHRNWREYFRMVPDYRIHVREILVRDRTVVLLGDAEGTFAKDGKLRPENHWAVPAAWRAVVEGGRIAVWQVYVNPEPMQRIIDRMGGC
jgi:hypothetical protein